MRRAPIVLTATAAGMAATLGFQARTPAVKTAAASTPASSPTKSSTSGGTKVVTGDAVDTQYGPARIRVTVKDGKITNIEALELQANDPKSAAISAYAEPLLRQSALTRQSADIDVVSGATFTSQSYKASLQSALDKAGFTTPASAG